MSDYETVKDILAQGPLMSSLERLVATQALKGLRPKGVRLTVCVLVMDSDGKMLCVTRKDDPSRVCFPGGHVEVGDFPAHVGRDRAGFASRLLKAIHAAGVRELLEETGLQGSVHNIVFQDVDESNNLCVMLSAKIVSGNLTPEVGTECLWLTFEEFMARCAWPGYYGKARACRAL